MNRPQISFTWNNIEYSYSPLEEIQSKDENKGKLMYEFLGMPKEEAERIHNTWLAQVKRYDEYPPIQDYIDGVVKGDQNQIDTYIAKCKEVKLKYPKPE